MKKVLFRIGLYLMWFTLGIVDTIFGLLAFLFTIPWQSKRKYQSDMITVKLGKSTSYSGWGLEAGPFVFSNTDVIFNEDGYLFTHEFGHCVPQTLVTGFLHFFICSIPSMIRYNYREWLIKTKKKTRSELPPYDSFWVEKTATNWGAKWHKILKDKGYID